MQAERLIALGASHARPLILTHDNPDPDALGAAVGLAQLFRDRCGVAARIGYGGIVGRAENRALIKRLALPCTHTSRLNLSDFDLFCLVDSQPASGNHSLPSGKQVDVVIDHHPPRGETWRAAFAEVGGPYGATSTILVEYLRAVGLTPTTEVATALFYGIKSDTRDLGRMTRSVDEQAYLYLFPLTDKAALAEIEHPALPANYFRLYDRALKRARVHGEVVAVDLGEIYTPDMVAEVSERLLSLEGMKASVALASYQGHLLCSLRVQDRRLNAGRLIRAVTSRHGGSAGGHGAMAGARLPVPTPRRRAPLARQVLEDLLEGLGAAPGAGVPLLDLAEGH